MGRTFPGDTVYESVIDVKEQNRTQDIMYEITYRISNSASNKMIVSFIKATPHEDEAVEKFTKK